jgi:flagellar biosynthesis protein FlhA
MVKQTLRESTPLYLAAAFAFALSFTGLPMILMMSLGAVCAMAGWMIQKSESTGSSQSQQLLKNQHSVAAPAPIARTALEQRPEESLTIEPIELELGFRLIKLADPEVGGDLLDRVTRLRSRIAADLGIVLPKVKIRDSLRINDFAYQIKLRGAIVASGSSRPDLAMAIDTGAVSGELVGVDLIEPAAGRPAKWIEPTQAEYARSLGYQVVEPVAALVSHLSEVVRRHADELLTRQQLHQLLDHQRQTSPKVVDELIPEMLKPVHVHRILCNLLRERIPVRDLETILETLGEAADQTKNIASLTERVRQSLSRTISQLHRDSTGTIHALTLDPSLEELLRSATEAGDNGPVVKLAPMAADGIIRELARQAKKLERFRRTPVVVCSEQVRPALESLIRNDLPRFAVLSHHEIDRETRVQSHGQVSVHSLHFPIKQPERSTKAGVPVLS